MSSGRTDFVQTLSTWPVVGNGAAIPPPLRRLRPPAGDYPRAIPSIIRAAYFVASCFGARDALTSKGPVAVKLAACEGRLPSLRDGSREIDASLLYAILSVVDVEPDLRLEVVDGVLLYDRDADLER